MRSESGARRASIAIGLVLILVGAGLLLGWTVDVDIGWPIWVIGPGLVIFVLGFVVGGSGGVGFVVAGSIVTTVGLILAVQEATDTWASWAYAWALVAPGAVGAGLLLYGLWSRDREMARGGLAAMVAGAVIFLIGFAFFEGVLTLNDLTGPIANLVVPAVLVGLGAVLIVLALLPRRGRPTPTGPGTGATAAAGGPSQAAAGPELLDLPLAPGTTAATVEIAFGGGRLVVGPALPGRLVDGECDGGVVVQQTGAGHVRLSPPSRFDLRPDRAPFDWLIGLSGEVPLRVSLEVGAADVTADLAALRVADLRVRTGAAQLRVNLPRTGVTRVDAEGGAASLSFVVPPGVAARIRSSVALGSIAIDEARFPRQGGRLWASPGADTAADRVELDVRGGVGSVSVG